MHQESDCSPSYRTEIPTSQAATGDTPALRETRWAETDSPSVFLRLAGHRLFVVNDQTGVLVVRTTLIETLQATSTIRKHQPRTSVRFTLTPTLMGKGSRGIC